MVIAHGASHFDNDDIGIILTAAPFDLLDDRKRDIGYDVNTPSFVFQIPFLLNHSKVNAARGHIIRPRKINSKKTFVVPHVLIALHAVIQNKNLAVFGGVHSACVDVDVGVDLHRGDREALPLEDCSHGGGSDTLADARHDATYDEYVLALTHN